MFLSIFLFVFWQFFAFIFYHFFVNFFSFFFCQLSPFFCQFFIIIFFWQSFFTICFYFARFSLIFLKTFYFTRSPFGFFRNLPKIETNFLYLFQVIGFIPAGFPTVQPPPFGYIKNNETIYVGDMLSTLGSNLIVLPLIALLENIAICKAFCKLSTWPLSNNPQFFVTFIGLTQTIVFLASGKPVDATQEMIAMGVCNIGNSFVQGFPGSGSLSRSAVNEASGVRTPLGGLYTGLLVIVALLFFTPYFYFIPKATLAAVIIAAVVFMVEVRVIKPMWRTKSEFDSVFRGGWGNCD